jgi:hypothetical protein
MVMYLPGQDLQQEIRKPQPATCFYTQGLPEAFYTFKQLGVGENRNIL